jgi:hypothetical protein
VSSRMRGKRAPGRPTVLKTRQKSLVVRQFSEWVEAESKVMGYPVSVVRASIRRCGKTEVPVKERLALQGRFRVWLYGVARGLGVSHMMVRRIVWAPGAGK